MKIFYFYDALCGWCYGFSPVITGIYNELKEQISFEIISGGMIRGSRVGPYSGMAAYILNAIPRVEGMTGVTFGEQHKDVLRTGTEIMSSLEPSIALTACKQIAPDLAIPFASALQRAHFLHGKSYHEDSTYISAADETGLASETLLEVMRSEEIRYKTNQEFRLAEDFGIEGFPACVAEAEGKYYLLSRGYANRETFLETLEKVKVLIAGGK